MSLITWIIPSKKRRPDESRRSLVDYGVSITRNKFLSLQCTTLHQESLKYQTSVCNNATTVKANSFILQQRKFLGRSITLQIPYSLKPSKEQIVGNNSMTRHHRRKWIPAQRIPDYTVIPDKRRFVPARGELFRAFAMRPYVVTRPFGTWLQRS